MSMWHITILDAHTKVLSKTVRLAWSQLQGRGVSGIGMCSAVSFGTTTERQRSAIFPVD